MILFICTKNELNLTNRYWRWFRTDGMDGRTDDAKTISLRLCRGKIDHSGGKQWRPKSDATADTTADGI